MGYKIENDAEFDSAIDEYGEMSEKIEQLKSDAKLLRQLTEAYADEHNVKSRETKNYRLKMKKGESSLRMKSGYGEADVVALLKRSEVGRMFVIETYDAVAIKRDWGDKAHAEQLDEAGLMLTCPKRHAVISGS